MATPLEALTQAIVTASGRPGTDPAVTELRNAAQALAAPPPDPTQQVTRWRAAVVALAGGDPERLLMHAWDLPDIPALADGLAAAVRAGNPRLLPGRDVGGSLGPLQLSGHLPAVTVGRAGHTELLGLLPPVGFSARLDTGPLVVSGGVARDASGISGHLAATLGVVSVGAFATLRQAPDAGVAVVLGARFSPGIQVGFGFELSSLGGAVAVGRGLDVDALRRALDSGSAVGLFFPAEPSGLASRVPLLLQVFESRPGATVAGPSAEATWLQVGGVSFLRLSVVALLELPRGRLVVLGRGAVEVPPVLSFRLDVLGEVDAALGVVALDLALVEGRVLGILRAGGTMAMRVRTRDPSYALLTIGGFFPGFRPGVPGLPEQRRISLGPDLPLPITFRFEGYLAVTDGTFQAGARVEIGFSAGVSVRGHLSFDAIAQLDPFSVRARIEGGVEVEALGVSVGGVRFHGVLDGPGPLVLRGEVSVKVLGVRKGWNDRFVLERSTRAQLPPVHDLVGLVALGDQRKPDDDLNAVIDLPPAQLRVTDGTDPHVEVTAPTMVADRPVVPARGALVWTQTTAPFETPLTRVASRRLAHPSSLRLVPGTGVGAGPTEDFAPASFGDHDQAALLSLPAYERLPSGCTIRPGLGDGPERLGVSIGYDEYYRGEADRTDGLLSAWTAALSGLLDALWSAPIAKDSGQPTLTLHAEAWEVRRPGAVPERQRSRTAAVLGASTVNSSSADRAVASAVVTPVADVTGLWEPA